MMLPYIFIPKFEGVHLLPFLCQNMLDEWQTVLHSIASDWVCIVYSVYGKCPKISHNET